MSECVAYSLICTATYTVPTSGEELLLRKFFKFSVCFARISLCCLCQCAMLQVAKPLDVKTKFMNIEVLLSLVFLVM